MKQIEQTLTSMEVAEMVGKDHSKLLRDIRTYTEQLDEAKIGLVNFFTQNTYKDTKGEVRPCYQVTKKGCEFIAHKLTGVKGTEFTAKYINKFHNMESKLQKAYVVGQPKSHIELLEMEFEAIKEVDSKVEDVRQELNDFKQDMPLLGMEIDKITAVARKRGVQLLGGKDSSAYKDPSVRGKLYSELYTELKEKYEVYTYKAIKRNQIESAIALLESFKPSPVLSEIIKAFNRGCSL